MYKFLVWMLSTMSVPAAMGLVFLSVPRATLVYWGVIIFVLIALALAAMLLIISELLEWWFNRPDR